MSEFTPRARSVAILACLIVPTEDGGTTFLDFDFTDTDDPPAAD